mmetsp:Transcript_95762/g.166377  ORF Transcript_95762/g.166377 Transcript_95762/m.166377 type:complete len:207 (+) Transcript_95762:132-752(+)
MEHKERIGSTTIRSPQDHDGIIPGSITLECSSFAASPSRSSSCMLMRWAPISMAPVMVPLEPLTAEPPSASNASKPLANSSMSISPLRSSSKAAQRRVALPTKPAILHPNPNSVKLIAPLPSVSKACSHAVSMSPNLRIKNFWKSSTKIFWLSAPHFVSSVECSIASSATSYMMPVKLILSWFQMLSRHSKSPPQPNPWEGKAINK